MVAKARLNVAVTAVGKRLKTRARVVVGADGESQPAVLPVFHGSGFGRAVQCRRGRHIHLPSTGHKVNYLCVLRVRGVEARYVDIVQCGHRCSHTSSGDKPSAWPAISRCVWTGATKNIEDKTIHAVTRLHDGPSLCRPCADLRRPLFRH